MGDMVIEATVPAWTLPINTLYYFGLVSVSVEGGRSDARNPDGTRSFHHLYPRVKRASKWRDNLWEDITREATEDMGAVSKYARPGSAGQVVGSHDPYVLLTVGLEVRLFRWEQGFDDSVSEEVRMRNSPFGSLRELRPGTVLNVCEKADREEIEKFLDQAKQYKKMMAGRDADEEGDLDW